MTTGYILIAAILILGGVIATVGDRIGTRVGKARLRLFNLRPRNTAVVITIATGSLISVSTLAILFAVDDRLRTGVFELENIQRRLRHSREDLKTTRRQLETTTIQKGQVEQELSQARAEQKEAQKRLTESQASLEKVNKSLQQSLAKQSQTQAQLSQITSQFQQAQARLRTVSQQAKVLRSEIQQSQSELKDLIQQRNQLKANIAQRDQEIARLDQRMAQLDRDIAERDTVIARRETRLKELEQQQNYLERAVAKLGQSYQDLRRGNLALLRGQVLASGVVRIVQPQAAQQAVDQILREANRNALQLTQPGTNTSNKGLIRISNQQVEQIIDRINDGRDYVVRIRSAGNYVIGEKRIQVFADVALNQVVFGAGDVLAAISVNPSVMTVDAIQQRVELLLGAARFRTSSAGILSDKIQIGDSRIETLIRFIDQLQQYNQPLEIKAIAAEDTYTSGPLKMQLVAIQNNQIVFSTQSTSGEPRGVLESPSRRFPPPVIRPSESQTPDRKPLDMPKAPKPSPPQL